MLYYKDCYFRLLFIAIETLWNLLEHGTPEQVRQKYLLFSLLFMLVIKNVFIITIAHRYPNILLQ